MGKNLVSIVTPCYNMANYIHRLLDSILQQTYPNIEMIVVNDGSTDNSIDVINSYESKFKAKGYSFIVISQKNSGQSVAIREGLKLITGKYITWPDSDDFYSTPTAIEQMVNTFENLGDDYGLIRSQGNLLEDKSLKVIKGIGLKNQIKHDEQSLFEDCLFNKNGFYFLAGGYMADFSRLKSSTTLNIYTDKNAGQNWQLLLPILYNYKCFTITKRLFNVVSRDASHSRGLYKGYDKTIALYTSYEKTLLGTLDRINGLQNEDKNNYSLDIKRIYCLTKLRHSFRFQKKADFLKYYFEAKKLGCISKREVALRILIMSPTILKGLFYIRRHLLNKSWY